MLTNGFVTLYRFDETQNEYVRTGSYPAWIYRQVRTKTAPGGILSRDVYDVRIRHRINEGIHSGDLILFEKSYSERPEIKNCSRVAAITHNNVGSVPHWHIEAENQYR